MCTKCRLTFKVGNEALSNFRMIERHYFRNNLVKSFDFNFGFCIPGSTNTWEAVYDVPKLDDDLIEEMIRHPFETHSDSFYFVGDELIMHNKARYRYITEYHATHEGLCDNAEAKDMVRVGYNNGDCKKCIGEDEGKCIEDLEENYLNNDLSSSFGEAKISSAQNDESFDSSAESKDNDRDAKYGDAFWAKDNEYEAKH